MPKALPFKTTDDDEAPRAIGYVRTQKSDRGLSPGTQRGRLYEYVEEHGLELVEICEDIDVDVEANFEKRKGLSKAIALLGQHDATILLAARQDRFSVTPMKGLFIEQMCRERGAALCSVEGDIAWGDEVKEARDLLAEFQAAQAGVDAAVGFGDNPGDWRIIEAAQNLSTKKRNTDPKTGMPVSVQLSPRQIAEALFDRGYKDRRGNKFSPSAVQRMQEMRTPEMENRKAEGDRQTGRQPVAVG